MSTHGSLALFYGHSIYTYFTRSDAARSARCTGRAGERYFFAVFLFRQGLRTNPDMYVHFTQAASRFPDIVLVEGTVVNADGASKRDVLISGGLIIAVAKDLEVCRPCSVTDTPVALPRCEIESHSKIQP